MRWFFCVQYQKFRGRDCAIDKGLVYVCVGCRVEILGLDVADPENGEGYRG